MERGKPTRKRLRKVDLYLSKSNTIFLIDLKTDKPNVSGVEKYKQDMLEWMLPGMRHDNGSDVRVIIAISYNPYAPKPYNCRTLRGMLEIENQNHLMVGEEFWNFLAGGDDIYKELLDCF